MVPDRLRFHARRMARFALVGVANSAIDFAVFAALFYLAGAPLLLANSIGYLCGLANSYLMNSRWTFRDPAREERLSRAGLYAALNLVGLLIANGAIWLLANFIPAWLAKLGAIVVTFAWNYWSSHRLVFARAPS